MQVLARHSSAQLALPCVACPHQDQKAFTLVFISYACFCIPVHEPQKGQLVWEPRHSDQHFVKSRYESIHPTTENRGSAQRHDWYYAACGSEVPWYPCALARADLLSTSAARAGRCCIRKQLFIDTFPPERFTGR